MLYKSSGVGYYSTSGNANKVLEIIKRNPMDLIQNATGGGYFTSNEITDLRGKKVEAKISDVDYLNAHPEVEQVIELLYMSVLEHKPPRDQLYIFVAKFFRQLNEERQKAMG